MTSDPDVEMARAVGATKSSSSFVIGALKREMEAWGAEGTVIHRLVVALQAALIDAGFLAANPPGSPLGLLKDWSFGASSALTVKYTLPELVAMLPEGEEGKTAVLNYSLMSNFVMIYGCVHNQRCADCAWSCRSWRRCYIWIAMHWVQWMKRRFLSSGGC
jgi:hypothetical protein